MAFAPALLAPPTPEEQDAALVANVVDPQALGASQVLPPPPPPAPAANLPLDALMAAASAPPPVAPVAPVDAALAPALPPDGGPALSVLPPPEVAPEAVPGTPVEAAKGNVAKLATLDKEQEAINAEKTRLETEQATAKAEHDRQRSIALDKLQQQQEMHRVQAASAVAEARSKAESEPYHTLLESRSVGQNVATAIGLILGGVSWNANHVNRGVQMLEMAMRENEVLQRQKHEDLWHAVAAAERGEAALDQRQLRETAAFSARQGAAWDAVAGRLGAMIAANKGKGDTATAKRVMIESSEKAVTAWQNAESAAAAAAHMKEMDEETARHHREQEATSLLRAQKYKTKGGGAGAGGGFAGKVDQAAVTLQKEIDARRAENKPMGLGEIKERGIALGIPLNPTKSIKTSVKGIIDDMGKAQAGEARELALTEKDEARTIRWKGREFMAPRANQVKDVAKDLANMEKYNDLIQEFASDIRKNGFIVDPGGTDNPQTEKGKRRMSLAAEVQALGRQISALQATDAGQKLEGQMIGHAGVGFKPGTASPDALEELRHRALKLVNTKLSTMLTPVDKTQGDFRFEGGGKAGPKLPPGAVPGTKKSTGQKGYQLDGKFVPFEADIVL